MRKTLDLAAQNIHGAQHLFRNTASRPHKEQKHRYERRKVKECLRLADWADEA